MVNVSVYKRTIKKISLFDMLHNQVLTVLFLKIFSGLSYILYTCIMLICYFTISSYFRSTMPLL